MLLINAIIIKIDSSFLWHRAGLNRLFAVLALHAAHFLSQTLVASLYVLFDLVKSGFLVIIHLQAFVRGSEGELLKDVRVIVAGVVQVLLMPVLFVHQLDIRIVLE